MSKEKHLRCAEGCYHMMEQDLFGRAKFWEYSMYMHLFQWAGWRD